MAITLWILAGIVVITIGTTLFAVGLLLEFNLRAIFGRRPRDLAIRGESPSTARDRKNLS